MTVGTAAATPAGRDEKNRPVRSHGMDGTDGRTDLPDAPPSVRAVLETLRREAPLTMKAMQERTGLGRRTLYTVLQRLRATGSLRERVNLRDTRQTFYWLEG